jgi:outer membrane protein
MRHAVIAALALSLVAPAVFAQSRSFDLTANAVWVDPTSQGSFKDLADPADIEFDPAIGYGVAANVFFTDRVSAEFAVSRVKPESTVRRRAVSGTSGDLDMMPLTAVLQYHFAPNGFIDPYVGAGAAYVLFDDVKSDGLNGIEKINFKDDAGLAVNAGLGVRLSPRLGLNLDAKYIPLESNATATVVGGGETQGKVDISPIIVSAGLSLRF